MLVAVMAAVTGAVAHAETVQVQRPTPYGEESYVADKIKQECKITEQLPDFLGKYAKEQDIDVKYVENASPELPGRVLVMHIVSSTSQGNAFIGHAKSTTVKGELYQDGQMVGDFIAERDSMGGMFAGFKGSCSVLGRTVKVLGEDIATWLKHPQMKSALGDR
jgi:hypothetical protein